MSVFDWRSPGDWWQLIRYYAAGLINLAFGFLLFSLLVYLGMHVYLAQALSHFTGVMFNYLTYSRYVFDQNGSSKFRFGLSYVGNYLLGLVSLWAFLKLVDSPYIAGLMSAVAVSLINFVVLKALVFRKPAVQDGAVDEVR
jgi:putative flippase GtrA